jgi:hypothetical protein
MERPTATRFVPHAMKKKTSLPRTQRFHRTLSRVSLSHVCARTSHVESSGALRSPFHTLLGLVCEKSENFEHLRDNFVQFTRESSKKKVRSQLPRKISCQATMDISAGTHDLLRPKSDIRFARNAFAPAQWSGPRSTPTANPKST